uniref:Kruppel like factor 17 n=2 Tax=Pipistrellus kuhlii TaxID=59472 RepID=A0A7J8A766_PIPKU|nr:Kruppel like factor 17 [Pipistrellus kuhlii]
MEREDQWRVAPRPAAEDTDMCDSDMSPSPESSGVHTSWNHDPSGNQHFLQSPQLERMPLVPAPEPRQSAGGMGPQFNVLLREHRVNYCPRVTFPSSQIVYYQRESPSQPAMPHAFNGSQMSFGEPSIPGMAMVFGGNLNRPPNGPPVTRPHMMTPTMQYSGHPTVPSNGDSLTPTMSLPAPVPSVGGQAGLPPLAQMLPPRDPHNSGMPPDGAPSLQRFGSQGSFVSQPASQENPFLPEQPTPAPQGAEQDFGAPERADKSKSPISRPFRCDYENCGKAYTKRSHLLSHLRKHTGERPYKCEWGGCSWSFSRSDELGRHMRIHTKHRPHKCEHCGRQFMRSDHLRQHLRTHQRAPKSPSPQADDEERAGPSSAPDL